MLGSRVLLRSKFARHELWHSVAGCVTVKQDAVHHLYDGHVYAVLPGESECTRGGCNALRHRFFPFEGSGERRTSSEFDTERTVTAECTRTRQHEITNTSEPGKGRRSRAESDAEPRH